MISVQRLSCMEDWTMTQRIVSLDETHVFYTSITLGNTTFSSLTKRFPEAKCGYLLMLAVVVHMLLSPTFRLNQITIFVTREDRGAKGFEM